MKPWFLMIFLILLIPGLGSACQRSDRTGDPALQSSGSPARTLQSPQPVDQGDLSGAIASTTEALLSGINLHRALDGWHPLVVHAPLATIAHERALDMSVEGYLSHEDPETGENPAATMIAEHGYHGHVAELVYAASVPLDRLSQTAIDEWFDDPDTRAVLLSPGFRFIGIGIMGDGTTWKIVQILAESSP